MTDMTAEERIRAIILEPDPIPMSIMPNGLLMRVDIHIRQAEAAARRKALEEALQIADTKLGVQGVAEAIRTLMDNPND